MGGFLDRRAARSELFFLVSPKRTSSKENSCRRTWIIRKEHILILIKQPTEQKSVSFQGTVESVGAQAWYFQAVHRYGFE